MFFIDRKRRWLKSEILDGDAKGTFVEIKLEPYSQEDSFKSTVSISIDLKLQKMDNMLSSFAKNQIKEEIESRIKEIENLLYKLP